MDAMENASLFLSVGTVGYLEVDVECHCAILTSFNLTPKRKIWEESEELAMAGVKEKIDLWR